MSTHSISILRDQELLGDLLHSLSQPLTSLRCSLELSIDEVADQQQQTVSAALQQTETVIGMIQLMREYLDADECAKTPIALMPALRSLVENLSSVAGLRNVRLQIVGDCSVTMRVAESRLRLALQYLILAMIDRQPANSEITLLLIEGRAGTVLRAWGERCLVDPESKTFCKTPEDREVKRDSIRTTMRRAQLAIANRVLESAGATLAFDEGTPGFVLRVPHVGERLL